MCEYIDYYPAGGPLLRHFTAAAIPRTFPVPLSVQEQSVGGEGEVASPQLLTPVVNEKVVVPFEIKWSHPFPESLKRGGRKNYGHPTPVDGEIGNRFSSVRGKMKGSFSNQFNP